MNSHLFNALHQLQNKLVTVNSDTKILKAMELMSGKSEKKKCLISFSFVDM